jgi:hemerythrin-like domain-containing protein
LNETRRHLLTVLPVAGLSLVGGALLIGCRPTSTNNTSATNDDGKEPAPGEAVPEQVTAIEDLMREHGILRRALLVYQDLAVRFRQDPQATPLSSLEKTAQLFRVFGEDYHEKRLEEAFIIPVIKKVQGGAAGYGDVLLAQHARGREITDYLLSVSKSDRLSINQSEGVARALDSFVRMYEHHAAFEDTVVFPAWKAATGEQEYQDLGEKFEEIEIEQFGADGFEAALKRITEIEAELGLTNLDMFTAPAPPK